MKGLRYYYRKLYKMIVGRLNPNRYAKKVGVNIGEELHIYGHVDWSTEPWIITIGNHVHITDGVKFITHDAGKLIFVDKIPDLEITKPIVIGDNVYIGNNVLLLPGITVGSNVVIGAGAVVSRDIPDNSVAVGVPARVIKTSDEYLEKIKNESLHLGHLKDQEKDEALMEYYNYKGNSKGIYF